MESAINKEWGLNPDCQFIKDMCFEDNKWTRPINVNGSDWSLGIYNLTICRSQVNLFCKGIIPHRNWRLKDIKFYFGITGGKEKVLAILNELCEAYDVTTTRAK